VPLRINAFTIWQRIIEKFDLEEGGLEDPAPQLDTVISPIFDIDHATRGFTRGQPALDLTASAGTYVAGLTVGANLRWRLEVIQSDAVTANSQIVINVSTVEIPLTTLATVNQFLLNPGITLQEGDSIGMLTTGDAGDSARRIRVRYSSELIRVVSALP